MLEMSRIEFAKKLLVKFNEQHIKYCVLRNYEELNESIGHDIDILIDPQSIDKELTKVFDKIINDLGWSYTLICNEKNFCTVICYDFKTSVEILKLDIWTQLEWRGLPWIDHNTVFNTIQPYDEIFIPSNGVEAAITLLKEIVGGGKIPEKYYDKIATNALADETNFIKSLEKIYGGYSEHLFRMCKQGKFNDISNDPKLIKNMIASQNKIKYMTSSMKRLVSKFTSLMRNDGKLIVFLGPDGSGKSTIIDSVSNELVKLDKKTCHYHIRTNIFPELKTGLGLSSMKGKISNSQADEKNSSESKVAKPVKRSFISKMASWVVVLYYLLEFFISKPLIAWKKRRSMFIFFDRYYYDFFTQPTTRDLIWNQRKLLYLFIPKPDVIIHLYAHPEYVFQRKGELNIPEIATQNEYLKRVLAEFTNSYHIVNEHKSIEEVTREVYEAIGKDIL